MATFRVGQLVRINCPTSPRHGREARVISGLEERLFVPGLVVKLAHDVELLDGQRHGESGAGLAYMPCQLQPIVPEGHQACEDDFKRDLDRLLQRQGVAA